LALRYARTIPGVDVGQVRADPGENSSIVRIRTIAWLQKAVEKGCFLWGGGSTVVAHYEFFLLASDGALRLYYATACTGDEHALATGRQIMQSNTGRSRLEIWRDAQQIYDGSFGTWAERAALGVRAAA
jgi:hypothetical protein